MFRKAEIRGAAAVCAALAGAGFASGREIETFFARLGAGSWLGAIAACAALGFIVAALVALSRREKAAGFPELYPRGGSRAAVRLVHGLLTLMTAAAMTAAGGELGALALDADNARLAGVLAALLAGAGLAAGGPKALGHAGVILAPAMALFYAALAAGPGESAVFSGEGLVAAAPMGLLYAALGGALTAGTAIATGREDTRPGRVGLLTSLIMLIMLTPANAALLRCGEKARQSALPAAALAAVWGVAGFRATLALMALAVATTLGAMLSALRDQGVALGLPRGAALGLAALGAAVLSACAFAPLASVVYPLLGWACAFALLSLLARFVQFGKGAKDTNSPGGASPSGEE